jgi:(5-formylfuran-3-yl)methyl phosphate synthase
MIPGAPRLLVSVRNAREALDALAGGADWIDLKEPRRGALGAVDPQAAREIVVAMDGRAPISAAGGELLDWATSDAQSLLAVPGIDHVKLGLAGCAATDWRTVWRAAGREIADAGKSLVAVIYADSALAGAPPAAEVLDAGDATLCTWGLWDTFDKSHGPLTEHTPPNELAIQLQAARASGLCTVVAGRLNASSLPRLPLELIDMIAVRGAVCEGSRESAVCRERVCALARAIHAARRLHPSGAPTN